MATLDFTKNKKQYLTIKFTDGQSIMVSMPSKKLLSELMEAQATLTNPDVASMNELDAVYILCAKLLSRNKANIKITADYLEDMFDLEDIMTLFTEYMKFVSSLANIKN